MPGKPHSRVVDLTEDDAMSEDEDQSESESEDASGSEESEDEPDSSIALQSATLSTAQKAALAAQARPVGSSAFDEPQTHPLPAAVMAGKEGASMSPGRVITFEQKMEALCVAWSPDEAMLAVGARNGNVTVTAPTIMPESQTLPLEVPGGPSACTSVQFRPGGTSSSTQNVVVAAKGEHIIHCHVTSGTVMRSVMEEGNRINAVSCRADGEMFATAGSDAAVRVYDESRRVPLVTLTAGGSSRPDVCGHSNSVFALTWKPEDWQMLLSGGWDSTVQMWDLRVGKSVRSLQGPYICGDALDARGLKVLTGSWRHDAPLQLWDYGSGRLMTNLPFHQPGPESCKVYSAKFGRGAFEGQTLAGGSGARPVARLYNKDGSVHSTLPTESAVHSVAWSQGEQPKFMAVCCAFQLHIVDCS